MPSASCCFLHVFDFTENQYLRRSKNPEDLIRFFWGTKVPESTGGRREEPQGPTAARWHGQGLGVTPRPPWAPCAPPYVHSSAYKFHISRNPSIDFFLRFFPPPQVPVPRRSNLEACSGTLPEGESIAGGFFINLAASMTMCE